MSAILDFDPVETAKEKPWTAVFYPALLFLLTAAMPVGMLVAMISDSYDEKRRTMGGKTRIP